MRCTRLYIPTVKLGAAVCFFFFKFLIKMKRKQAKAMKLPDISISVHIEICQKERSTELIHLYSVKI